MNSLMRAQADATRGSGGSKGFVEGSPRVAVLPFDVQATQDKPAGGRAVVYLSTKLAQGKLNVYDRVYFQEMLGIKLVDEKEAGKLLGVDKIIYGKLLEKTPVELKTLYKTVNELVVRDGKSVTVPVEKPDKVLATYGLEIQGRVTDVRTAFGKFKTVKKEPRVTEYPPYAAPNAGDLEHEWWVKLFDELAAWAEAEAAR
ncbi:hypothetical protein [Thermogutta sp.]|uniref:hypothetical protein n=1 Tax=Thermogutta sp. TaxID=1962930 RepID=UPI0032208919